MTYVSLSLEFCFIQHYNFVLDYKSFVVCMGQKPSSQIDSIPNKFSWTHLMLYRTLGSYICQDFLAYQKCNRQIRKAVNRV